MRLNPTRILQDLRATYWFIPSCMVAFAVALSFLMPWLDQRYGGNLAGRFSWVGQTQTDGARSVLVAIAGSIIGVAGTTFSITMVAVSFASANFGPRLIANFMRDRANQFTLGTFIATFVYCLLVLRRVHAGASGDGSAGYDAFVPHLSIIVALLLALASVGVLIFFIHHVPETINIDRLVADIGRQLKRSITALFPDPAEGGDEGTREGPLVREEREADRARAPVPAIEPGFVKRVDLERMSALAEARSLLVHIRYRPGDFAIEGDVLCEVWASAVPSEDRRDPEARDGMPIAELRDCFDMGDRRTAHQNCLFLADQLGEVIARAMSPGINDPFTAITCLSWLKSALVEYIERDAAGPIFSGTSRVFLPPIDFEALLAAAFDRTRQYVCADRDVALHAMAMLTEIGVRARRAEQRDALRRRMDELAAASAAALAASTGGDEVARRRAEGLRLIDEPSARERRRDGSDWFGGSG